jgi:prepilin-type processing-associated H-X9-DG protein
MVTHEPGWRGADFSRLWAGRLADRRQFLHTAQSRLKTALRPDRGQGAFTLVELVVIVAVVAFLGCLLVPALGRTRPGSQTFQCQNNLRQLQRAHTMYGTDNTRLIPNAGALSTGSTNWAPGWQDWNAGQPLGANTNAALLTNSPFAPYYGRVPGLFKCPADKVPSTIGPRLRSISMNGFIGGTTMKDAYGYNTYLIYQKESDFTRPGPARTWVFLDEHPDSINDELFGTHMPSFMSWPSYASWDDVPASYHNGACGISFADGHTEAHKWLDAATKAPVLKANPCGAVGRTSPNDSTWLVARTSAPL